jgi:hypothetical protein
MNVARINRVPALLGLGTVSPRHRYRTMSTPRNEGNDPSPLLMIAVAVVPLLGIVGWWIFG